MQGMTIIRKNRRKAKEKEASIWEQYNGNVGRSEGHGKRKIKGQRKEQREWRGGRKRGVGE